MIETRNVDSGEKFQKTDVEEKRRSFSRNHLRPRSSKGSINYQQWRVQNPNKSHHHFPAFFGKKYGQLLLYHLSEFSSYLRDTIFPV